MFALYNSDGSQHKFTWRSSEVERWRDVVKSVNIRSRFRHMDIKIQSIRKLDNPLIII
jgi:hypothetical protein